MDDDPERRVTSTALSPYPTSRLSPAISLVDVAAEIERADRTIGAVTHAKLEVIAKQIRALQDEARAVVAAAEESALLHRARCQFVRRPGHVYHLYRKPDGEAYFSMLSPLEWGEPPHPYVASYKLENDLSFTRVGEASGAARDVEDAP